MRAIIARVQMNPQDTDRLRALADDYRRYLASLVIFHLAAAEKVGLGATDYQAVSILDLDGAMTAGELAERIGLTSGATTRLVDRLVRAGHARRTTDPDDRRRVLVEPAASPPDGLDAVLADVRAPVAAVLQSLTAEQLEGVARYIRGAQHAYADAVGRLRPS
jgi:DNA-binding MarR family transcriptional regulator